MNGFCTLADTKNIATLRTTQDENLTVNATGASAMVQDITIATPGIVADNGVIQGIDVVLMPPGV